MAKSARSSVPTAQAIWHSRLSEPHSQVACGLLSDTCVLHAPYEIRLGSTCVDIDGGPASQVDLVPRVNCMPLHPAANSPQFLADA